MANYPAYPARSPACPPPTPTPRPGSQNWTGTILPYVELGQPTCPGPTDTTITLNGVGGPLNVLVGGKIAFSTGGAGLSPGGRGAAVLGNLGVYVNGARIDTIHSTSQTITIPAGYFGNLAFQYEDEPNTCADNSGAWSVTASFIG